MQLLLVAWYTIQDTSPFLAALGVTFHKAQIMELSKLVIESVQTCLRLFCRGVWTFQHQLGVFVQIFVPNRKVFAKEAHWKPDTVWNTKKVVLSSRLIFIYVFAVFFCIKLNTTGRKFSE